MKKLLLVLTITVATLLYWFVGRGVMPDNLTDGSLKTRETETSSEQRETRSRPVVVKEKYGLVNVADIEDTIIIDLRYATENNFTGKRIYPVALCLLQRQTLQKLINAHGELREMGYGIKIWDAYRPHYVQQILWDASPDKKFLANPARGSHHNRGTAVDVTLVDSGGREVEMPSGFDEFTRRAHRNYRDGPAQALENRELLTRVMEKHGFAKIQNEWWHFSDTESRDYPVLNLKLEEF